MKLLSAIFLTVSFLYAGQTMTIHKSNGSKVVLNTDQIDSITFAPTQSGSSYPVHTDIIASLFWVGEGASDANHGISNVGSAWRGDWGELYGVEDWPQMNRDSDGFPLDSRYKNQENPYYCALPYNDIGALISDVNYNVIKDFSITVDGDEYTAKKNRTTAVYWADDSSSHVGKYESMVKNRWIKITYNGKSCYAQWEDAGPFYYNDIEYVFDSSRPENEGNKGNNNLGAGIDFSPAVMKYLSGDASLGTIRVDWQFVDESDVPDGPWKRVITTIQTGGW